MTQRNTRNPLVSVAILTWNRREQVLRALESVFSQPYRPIEVVVVDSASTDGTCEAIHESYPNVQIIKLHRNMGCPEGRNVALANCSGDIIFSLDDDAWLAPSTLDLCRERFQMEPRLGIIACEIQPPGEDRSSDARERETWLFSGGACAIRQDILNKAGYYPHDFHRQAEEGDLALRVLEAGYSILHCPDAIVYHKAWVTGRKKHVFMFYGCRNELYTVIRRYPLFLIPAALVWKGFVWNWAGIRSGAIHSTLGACIIAALIIPKLLVQRHPVSWATIRRMIAYELNTSQTGEA